MAGIERLKYGMADLTVEEYETELDELWEELKDPNSDVSQEAKIRGIDVTPLRSLKRQDAIGLETGEAAFGVEVTLIIALAPLATEIVKASAPIIKDLWFSVLRPRILQKKGDHVLPEEDGT